MGWDGWSRLALGGVAAHQGRGRASQPLTSGLQHHRGPAALPQAHHLPPGVLAPRRLQRGTQARLGMGATLRRPLKEGLSRPVSRQPGRCPPTTRAICLRGFLQRPHSCRRGRLLPDAGAREGGGGQHPSRRTQGQRLWSRAEAC